MRSNRYVTNLMQATQVVVTMFAPEEKVVQGLEVATPFEHPYIIKSSAKFSLKTIGADGEFTGTAMKSLPSQPLDGFAGYLKSEPTPLGVKGWAAFPGGEEAQLAWEAKTGLKYMGAKGDSWYHNFIIGEARTSDHWFILGGSHYGIDATEDELIALGGYRVSTAYEENLWLFKKPITGIAYYRGFTVRQAYGVAGEDVGKSLQLFYKLK